MFSCFSLPALRIEQSAGSDVPSGKTPPPQGEAFSSFSIFHHHHYPDHTVIITLIIPSSLPWSYHHLPHHDHHDCYHNHHLKLERSFFCSFKIVAFYCVSPPSADIFSFVSFCTSFVIPPVNFNLSEYNNPPISNWSFAKWTIIYNLVVYALKNLLWDGPKNFQMFWTKKAFQVISSKPLEEFFTWLCLKKVVSTFPNGTSGPKLLEIKS